MKPTKRFPLKVLTGALAVLVGVEAVAIIEQALAPELPTGSLNFQIITSVFFLALAPLSPLLTILVLYSWVGKSLLRIVGRYDVHHALAERFRFLTRISQSLPVSLNSGAIPLLSRPFTILAIGMVSSCLLAFTPY